MLFSIRCSSYGAGPVFSVQAIKIWLLRSCFQKPAVWRPINSIAVVRPLLTYSSLRDDSSRPSPDRQANVNVGEFINSSPPIK
jgi:hypothetical protein